MSLIVDAGAGITLVGGAPGGGRDLSAALAIAPVLVAADGGADHCHAAGLTPVAVIGDMDSLSAGAAAAFAGRLHPVTEQETTDFDKALRHVRAPVVIAAGFSGGRFDHELAVLNTLLRRPSLPCIVLGRDSLTFLCPPEVALDLPGGMALSLFPMAPVGMRSTGLVWPTDGLDFRPDGRIGTSNTVGAGPVILAAERPAMLVILPRAALAAAAAAVTRAARWG